MAATGSCTGRLGSGLKAIERRRGRLPFTRKWRNWQTRQTLDLVPERVWGFESLLSHSPPLACLGSQRRRNRFAQRHATPGECVTPKRRSREGGPTRSPNAPMKTEFQDVSETQKNITIEIPSDVVAAEIDRVAKDYSKQA